MKPSEDRVAAVVAEARTCWSRVAAAGEEDVRAGYELGRTLRDVLLAERGAPRVIDAVARALGCCPSLMRRYARVAGVISPAHLDSFMAMRSGCDLPITWSHLEHLAEIRSVKMRAEVARRVVAERLPVRALVKRVRNLAPRKDGKRPLACEPRIREQESAKAGPSPGGHVESVPAPTIAAIPFDERAGVASQKSGTYAIARRDEERERETRRLDWVVCERETMRKSSDGGVEPATKAKTRSNGSLGIRSTCRVVA